MKGAVMKKIPIGVEDFKEIIRDNFYYIDKTQHIEEILNDGSKVKLFTRPRRFGKTLNMSTLKYFFDMKNAEENRQLFKGLNIEKSSYISEQGQYPVIFISLKGVKTNTWEEYLSKLKSLIKRLYNEFEYIRCILNESERDSFDRIWLQKAGGDYENSLRDLTAYLYKYYKKEAVLLIDEYDSPLITAYEYHYYDEAVTFFKMFYGEALKTNPYLKMGVMTGIIRVIKAGIFSDLNNLSIYSILDKQYSDYFGFTRSEVEKALESFDMAYEIPEVKLWYDGYKFGNSGIYNPWSILKFLQNKELEAYWVGTSENFLIKKILTDANSELNKSLETLFNGEKLEEVISGNSDLSSLLDHHEIWELLLFSGYLTIERKIERNFYSLRLPNKEVKEFFKDEFIDTSFGTSQFKKTMEALKKRDICNFEKNLQEILLTSSSYMDMKTEDFYHGLILGMSLYLDSQYYITSNKEAGLGRYDLLLEPKNKEERGFILEFKVVKNKKDLENVSKEAIEQIINKKYDINLKRKGIKQITLVGIAFHGKLIKVSYMDI